MLIMKETLIFLLGIAFMALVGNLEKMDHAEELERKEAQR